ncbi:MAG: hypothetical protein QNJ54_29600 [Prochloraceae cyanobacterium]|nr:hypothetical protein [Prochloraceae cyanobacterium]
MKDCQVMVRFGRQNWAIVNVLQLGVDPGVTCLSSVERLAVTISKGATIVLAVLVSEYC